MLLKLKALVSKFIILRLVWKQIVNAYPSEMVSTQGFPIDPKDAADNVMKLHYEGIIGYSLTTIQKQFIVMFILKNIWILINLERYEEYLKMSNDHIIM